MKVARGDVVLLDYPFSTGTGSKVRPALVVQANIRNQLLDHTILAMISKNTSHAATDPTQYLIELSSSAGAASGLKADSVVKCGNLFTVHESLVRKKIGKLPHDAMQQIGECLKTALEIS